MNSAIKLATAAAVLSLSVSGASADLILRTDANDQKVVVDTETQKEMAVYPAGPAGEKPGECPDGAFFLSKDPVDDQKEIITDCKEGTVYRWGEEPAAGLPEGAFLLQEDEAENKEVETDATKKN